MEASTFVFDGDEPESCFLLGTWCSFPPLEGDSTGTANQTRLDFDAFAKPCGSDWAKQPLQLGASVEW